MEKILKELLENKQVLNFPKKYYELLKIELDKLRKENKITGYQIGNIGDCGYCAFINQTDQIIIPCKNFQKFIPIC